MVDRQPRYPPPTSTTVKVSLRSGSGGGRPPIHHIHHGGITR
jgi:hypothetical protein